MVYICPRGSRGGMNYLFFEKSVFVKHPTLQTQAVFVGGVRKVRKVAKITIWVVAQVQMEEVLFMAVKNSKDSLPPTVASSKAVTANCIIVSTDAI